MSRQRANAALHALEPAGLLRLAFGGLTVLDVGGLRAYRAPESEPVRGRAGTTYGTG